MDPTTLALLFQGASAIPAIAGLFQKNKDKSSMINRLIDERIAKGKKDISQQTDASITRNARLINTLSANRGTFRSGTKNQLGEQALEDATTAQANAISNLESSAEDQRTQMLLQNEANMENADTARWSNLGSVLGSIGGMALNVASLKESSELRKSLLGIPTLNTTSGSSNPVANTPMANTTPAPPMPYGLPLIKNNKRWNFNLEDLLGTGDKIY